jgi:hypothetical protein
MSARVEAAAKMINARSVRPADWDDPGLTAYRFNRIYDARKVLAAADEVMFSEAAIERAVLFTHTTGGMSVPKAREIVRAVVAALREGA